MTDVHLAVYDGPVNLSSRLDRSWFIRVLGCQIYQSRSERLNRLACYICDDNNNRKKMLRRNRNKHQNTTPASPHHCRCFLPMASVLNRIQLLYMEAGVGQLMQLSHIFNRFQQAWMRLGRRHSCTITHGLKGITVNI